MESVEFRAHANLDAELLEAWIEAGWLTPASRDGLRYFSEVDLARTQLIKDLQEDFGINNEGIAVILHLVDQLHGLTHTLDCLLSALSTQPRDLRLRIYVRAATESRPVGVTRPKPSDANSRAETGPRPKERRFT